MTVDSESSTCIPNTPLVHDAGLIVEGIGRGFDNTSEIKPMKYKKSINGPDKENGRE